MKYIVEIADKHYEVEIEDINARPVIARVDGQEFKVNPEDGIKTSPQIEPDEYRPVELSRVPTTSSISTHELTAPLPGTVIEVFVKADDHIEAGQVILIIEAMKMKNSIRSTRAGKLAEVHVSAGQTVAHKQALVRFAD
jgi:glutaconyl-CoA/methylmalonyl-CoA decarboxylase subunit gamma